MSYQGDYSPETEKYDYDGYVMKQGYPRITSTPPPSPSRPEVEYTVTEVRNTDVSHIYKA